MYKIISFLSFLLFFSTIGYSSDRKLTVDLKRYMGTWHEVARLPNSFQEKCADNVTATYRMLDSGELSVINSCLNKDGKIDKAYGIAWLDSPEDTRKLKVSFVPLFKYLHLFSGDYWIYDLDSDYQWAIVGSPDKCYLWFLSRQKAISSSQFESLKSRASKLGFDVKDLIVSDHVKL